ncbi:hypothetical protein GCM10027169_14720 [Gordonia jinhuaensis]|uniref:Pyridoxamine 5'-phosphate oxidase N-terminal domain-containing protein n=1 Tax=Gordonia jinhuaensis TaxID=1517702 RepID=A0A916WQS2_9ACTN|nr:TIGR03667 family PPOX class F420-dependent oxidoreductase [Gordonia jinhuaensis]GGB23743.1 hypothetical protein GCM10011489_10050 [Gordonia jinhuaensis]
MANVDLSPRNVERLGAESVIWLTTVSASASPAPTPVWFLWRREHFIIFSQPNTGKLKHIAANPRVSLNLNSDPTGGDVAVFNGHARIDPDGPTDDEWSEYSAKYADGIPSIGLTPSGFRDSYSVLLRITPERLRSW